MIEVVRDNLEDGRVVALLEEHLREMHKYSPAESIHALDTQALKHPSMSFWSAHFGETFAGCGALKALSSSEGEVKSMRTVTRFLRQGVAAKVLEAIIAEAQTRGYQRLSLETGTHAAFAPAAQLYQRYGFSQCGPFANYRLDPYSVFYTRTF